ncbi:hypothetical protein SCOR_30520 [Sulfidibacter corallicola]
MLAICVCPFAGAVEFITSIGEVCARNDTQQAGTLDIRIDGDQFADASSQTPHYLQIRFDHAVLLAQTLVDIEGSDAGHMPINLAARLDSNAPANALELNMLENAIQIVRWRRGESSIWIRINHSSSQWLSQGGATRSPNHEHRIVFSIGIGSEASRDQNEQVLSNLDANRRVDGALVTTELMVDTRSSALFPLGSPEDRNVNIEPEHYDDQTRLVTTAIHEDLIIYGSPQLVRFAVDIPIGRSNVCGLMEYQEVALVGPLPEGRAASGSLILVNPSESKSWAEITWFTADGTELGTMDVGLPYSGEPVTLPLSEWNEIEEAASLRVYGESDLLGTLVFEDGSQWSLQVFSREGTSRIVRPRPRGTR